MEAPAKVVALIDMDCFYCACERALQPELCGQPLVVVQYNPFRGDGTPGDSGVKSIPAEPAGARVVARQGAVLMPSAINGSIIAVSYEAREQGVTRFMRGREARSACPALVIVQVPTAHGKSDMGVYRCYGARVRQVISEVCGPGSAMEKASVDEMYVDVTALAHAELAAVGLEGLAREAVEAGTHVGGAAEGASEANMGGGPGLLGRSAFRTGHAGQVERAMSDASRSWWDRQASEWPSNEALLAAGAAIVARARAAVTRRLGFTCSAGIAANKLLAKLCGGLHKPNQQTLLPPAAVAALLDPLPVDRLRGFGGKLGELLKCSRPDLGVGGFASIGELRRAGEAAVARLLQGEWAHPEATAATACRMAAGLDDAAVEERPLSKQVGSGKNFSGPRNGARGPLDTYSSLEGWVRELAQDVWARLEDEAEVNERSASVLVVGVRMEDGAASRSRRCPLRPGAHALTSDAMGILRQLTWHRPAHSLGVVGLSLTADAFVPIGTKSERGALQRMFQREPHGPDATRPVEAQHESTGSSSLPPTKKARSIAGESVPLQSFPAAGPGPVGRTPDAKVAPSPSRLDQSPPKSVIELSPGPSDSGLIDLSLDDPGGGGEGQQRQVDAPAQWACAACTLLNQASARCCSLCSTPRPGNSKPLEHQSVQGSAKVGTRKTSVGRASKNLGQLGIGAFMGRGN